MPRKKPPRDSQQNGSAERPGPPSADDLLDVGTPGDVTVRDLLAAKPDRVQDCGRVMHDIAAHMKDFLNRLNREVIPRLDSTDREDRAVGAAEASCIAQEIEVQIERTWACEADMREAHPPSMPEVPDAFSRFARSQEKDLRKIADEATRISQFLLRDPTDPCHDLLDR